MAVTRKDIERAEWIAFVAFLVAATASIVATVLTLWVIAAVVWGPR